MRYKVHDKKSEVESSVGRLFTTRVFLIVNIVDSDEPEIVYPPM